MNSNDAYDNAESNQPSSLSIYAALLCYFMNLWNPNIFSSQERVYCVMLGIPSVIFLCFVYILLYHKKAGGGGYLYYFAIGGMTLILVLVAMYFRGANPFVKLLLKNRLEPHAAAKEVFAEGLRNGHIISLKDCDIYLPTGGNTKSTPKTVVGLVMIPGALVCRKVYAVIATALAKEGILVVIPSTETLRLPGKVFGFTATWLNQLVARVETICARTITVDKWSVGGHSMGAQLAAEMIQECPKLQKLVLWGMYRLHGVDLARSPYNALLITASEDGFYFKNKDAEEALLSKLPPVTKASADQEQCASGTTWIHIVGGNHGGFGNYGPQLYPLPDGERKIPLEEQHRQIVISTAKFLKS